MMTMVSAARQVLNDRYDTDGELTPLYGELDDNFLVTEADGKKRILKIMHQGCDEQRVDMQCRAMTHLAGDRRGLNLPRVIPTNDGRPYSIVCVEGADRLVWLLRYCPGTTLKQFTPHDDCLIRSFGRTMGLIDKRLESFAHPAMRPGHKWEMTGAAVLRAYLRFVPDEAAAQVDTILQRFENSVAPRLDDLPWSVIHNDANCGNILVNTIEDGRAVVDGLIDFGDMTYQPTICEVAIALAYVVIDKANPFAVCARFLEGYHGANRLNADELAILYDLILTRLAVSISIGYELRARKPDDPLGRQDRGPMISTLVRLCDESRTAAERAFRLACSRPETNSVAEALPAFLACPPKE